MKSEITGTLAGPVKVDRQTSALLRRLKPGDIAIIDHTDLDRATAQSLVRARPAAVLNAAKSTSGRFPNLGPQILVTAGIPLVDDLGPDIMTLAEGGKITVDGAEVRRGEHVIADGIRQDDASVAGARKAAETGLSVQLSSFTASTIDYVRSEPELFLDDAGAPTIPVTIKGRPVLVVARHVPGALASLKRFLAVERPVLIGVEGGADVLLGAGLTPDVVVGDLDAMSEKALRASRAVVAHGYADDRIPGSARADTLGIKYEVFTSSAGSEDLALLLADSAGASLIVTLGGAQSLTQFLDQDRATRSSAFLTRLKLGGRLVDGSAVAELYRHRLSAWLVVLLILAGFAALITALAVTPAGQALLTSVWTWLTSLVT